MFFFFNDTATTEIYTLSLHDALPIWSRKPPPITRSRLRRPCRKPLSAIPESIPAAPAPTGNPAWTRRSPASVISSPARRRSEEHTSELQSRQYLVCRLLLEKKKNNTT